MSNLLEIMDKKSCGKSEIYISEEDGRWYACYRSAHLLKKLNETVLRGVMLDKVEVDFESSLANIKTNMTAITSLVSIASCNYVNTVSLANLHTVLTTDALNKHDAIQDLISKDILIGGDNVQLQRDAATGVYTVNINWPDYPERAERIVNLPTPQLIMIQSPSAGCPATCSNSASAGAPAVTTTTTTTTANPTTTTTTTTTTESPTGEPTTTTPAPFRSCSQFEPIHLGKFKLSDLRPIGANVYEAYLNPVGSGVYGRASNGSEDVSKYLTFYLARYKYPVTAGTTLTIANTIEIYNQNDQMFHAYSPTGDDNDYSKYIPYTGIMYGVGPFDNRAWTTVDYKGFPSIFISNPTPIRFNSIVPYIENGVPKTLSIVSVTTERLVQSGYLIRKNDIHDRRIQRLCLTEKCQPIIADGREMQTHFFTSITAGLTDEELKLYQKLSEKIRDQVIKLEKEL
jgi:hypothetical protein